MDQKSKYCPECKKSTLWARPGTNHILHLLMTVVTCSLWIPIWIVACIRIGGWRCQACGSDGFVDTPSGPADDDQHLLVLGGIKGGLVGGSVVGVIGMLSSSMPATAFLGITGFVAGAAIGALLEKNGA